MDIRDETFNRIRVGHRAEEQLRSIVVRRDDLSRRLTQMAAANRQLREEALQLRNRADRLEKSIGLVQSQEAPCGINGKLVDGEALSRRLGEIEAQPAALRTQATELTDRAAQIQREMDELRGPANDARRLVDSLLSHLGARSIRQVLVDWVDVDGELTARAIDSQQAMSRGGVVTGGQL